jgi:hypothetical protein
MRYIILSILLLVSSLCSATPLTWRAGLTFGVEPDTMKERVREEEQSYYRKYEYQLRRQEERLEESRRKAQEEQASQLPQAQKDKTNADPQDKSI